MISAFDSVLVVGEGMDGATSINYDEAFMIRNGRRCESSYQSDLSEYPTDYTDLVPAPIADDLLLLLRRLFRCRRDSTTTHCQLLVPLHLIDSGESLIQQAIYGD